MRVTPANLLNYEKYISLTIIQYNLLFKNKNLSFSTPNLKYLNSKPNPMKAIFSYRNEYISSKILLCKLLRYIFHEVVFIATF